MMKIVRLFFLLIILSSCDEGSSVPVNSEPKLDLYSVVPLNQQKGYANNQYSNDTLTPILNSFGDVIVTGKRISISPKKTKAQLPKNRVYQTLGEPEVIPIIPSINSTKVEHVQESIIDRSSLKKVSVSAKNEAEPILNSEGKAIVTGRELTIRAIEKKAIQTPAIGIDLPAVKEDVHTNIRFLDVDQGLSSSYIYSIIEDDLGRLYFGTYGNGLMVYDGHSIQSFTTKEGLSSNLIRKLFRDGKGNIWIGHEEGGLTKYDGKTFTNYANSNGFIGQNVYDIIEDQEGNIWCATNNGIVKFNGSKFIQYGQKEGLSTRVTWSICEDSKGRIWIGNDDGVVSCFDGTQFTEYGEKQGITPNSILAITEDAVGNIWISSMGSSVYRISGNTICHFSSPQGLTGQIITSITEDQNKNIWFTSFGNGLFKYDGTSIQQYTEKTGLNRMNYWMMHEDNTGNLWFGSEGAGATILREKSFNHFTTTNGLKSPTIWSMDKGNQTEFWFSNLEHGLVEKRQGSFAYYSTKQNLSSNNILALNTDSQHRQWLGYWGNGVDLIENGRITNFNTQNEFGSNYIFSIIEDTKGHTWFSTADSGVIKFDGEFFYQISEGEGLGKKNARTIFEDSKGIIWIGTDGAGLAKYDGGTITHYSEKEGLSSNFIRCIQEDNAGNIWIGTNTGGLSIFTGKNFIHINETHGLTNDNIRTIDPLNANTFLIGTEKGLNLVSYNGQNKDKVRISTLGKQDGLNGIDFMLNTSKIDADNRIWWATGKSLTYSDRTDLTIQETTPRSLISSIDLNQKNFDFTKENDSIQFEVAPPFLNVPANAKFTYDQNHLSFHFSGIDWRSSGKVLYSYRINNEEWSIPSIESKADYRNLSPNMYTFELRSMGSNYAWSDPNVLSFEIIPPWWKTWWAYLLYTLALAAITYAVYRYQLKRQLAVQEAKKLRELDKLKTDFFTNISHEFRTPLTIITGLKDRLLSNYRKRKDEAFEKNVNVLHKNSDQLLSLVNQLLEISKLEHGTVSLSTKQLEVYVLAKYELSSYGSTADHKNIQLDLDCPDTSLTIHADEKAFTSIYHNLLGNALKFTENGKISVGIHAKNESTVTISIRDTGIGIPSDELSKIFDRFYQVDDSSTKEFEGSGIGLSHVKQLIELQNASIHVRSELGKGTVFEMDFPRANDLAQASPVELEAKTSSIDDSQELDTSDTRPKLLIVEDNEDMRYFISLILEEDYAISTAKDGIEGLKMAQGLIPDFIISDWMMPKMTGPELLQRLKENISTSHIPMMLLTARADQDSKIDGYKHGADAYLTKPFESEELLVRIKVLIDAKRRLQQFYSSADNEQLSTNSDRPKIEDAFILKTIEFIQTQIANSELTGDLIAADHHLSRSQFARKLRTLTGKSVTEFIRNLRLAKAKELIAAGDLNVSEIAYEVGFSDPAYFTRVFTKEIGIAPSSWKTD